MQRVSVSVLSNPEASPVSGLRCMLGSSADGLAPDPVVKAEMDKNLRGIVYQGDTSTWKGFMGRFNGMGAGLFVGGINAI